MDNHAERTAGRVDEPTAPIIDTVSSTFKSEKLKLKSKEPIQLPREVVYGADIGGLVLLITAWPVLILGAILGALGMMKIGCPLNRR